MNATILFLLRCFASDCGVAIGFSFSRRQAAQTVIRLREHADPLCRMYVRQTQEGGVILNQWGLCISSEMWESANRHFLLLLIAAVAYAVNNKFPTVSHGIFI